MVTDNAHLLALNRVTGSLVWEVVMPDEAQHYGATLAPLVVRDMVVAGVSGGDWGIRGFIAAYKAGTGERVWRQWTVPAEGDPGYETWKGTAVTYGGAATWLTGSYDAETDTLYWLRAIRIRIRTIANEAATTCLQIACWRWIPLPER
jgi:glucose dehydrogenase